ncbi:MAG TPA: transglutaminase-like domain-containing protein [Verrucomicrobiae bacterium]|nr:transglutaminase-like domain-containing protein [Verrucomicrobiae bacterium]
MKRTAAFFALMIGLQMISGAPLPAQVSFQAALRIPAMADLISLSPKDLARFMRKNFRFQDDARIFRQEDYWQSPEEFWRRKTGDCEDYALFSQYVLSLQGKEAFVVSLYDITGYGHTVTLFKEDGRYNVMNEDRFYAYRSPTIEEALTRIHPLWTWAAVAVRNNTRGEMVRRLDNPDLA